MITLAISASTVFNKIWTILFAMIFFGIIIALHEFGHFITAKLFSITVNEFSIGMGPALFKKEKKGTAYALRLLPIGGYVQLEGEDEASDDPHAFSAQKAWKRFIVISAGAIINIILGLLLVCVMLGIDGSVSTTVVSDVSPSMTEIQTGDKIISIDGSRVFAARDLYYQLYRNDDRVYDIILERDGEKIELNDLAVTYDVDNGICSFIVGYKETGILNIIPGAIKETTSMGKLVYLSLIDMLGGKYGLNEMSGPVGTIDLVAETAEEAVVQSDYSSILFILAFITVNIGIVNLLPLPALDGGRLFFILIEIIIRRPVPKKFEAIVHAAGLVLLLALMGVITFNDIYKLIKGT